MSRTDDNTLLALLAACTLGDRRAFARLYDHASPTLFSIVLRLLGRRDWAEEALQDAFVQIWERAADYRPDRGRPITWMASIARYRAIDFIRSEGRHRSDFGDDTLASIADENTPQISGGDARLQECLKQLDSGQRQCIVLSYCEGYSHHELAKRLATPLGTVKTWIRRGVQRLKRCLQS
jgi:RNA polymerase sigma-70 factor (ECF subfamily)